MILGYSPGAQQGGPPANGRYAVRVRGKAPGPRVVTAGWVYRHQGRGPRGGRVVRWEAYCMRTDCRWAPARIGTRFLAARALDEHYQREHQP